MNPKPPSVYRSRNFVKLWFSQVVSKAGANFVEVALAVFAMRAAHGDLAAYGGLLFAGLLPAVVLGWAVAGVADRWDKRRTMVAGDVIRAALVLSIPLVGQLWWAFGAVFLVETVGLVYKPGVRAITPDTVGEGQVMAANGALSAGFSAVDVPAYLLVGLVVAQTGTAIAFVIDGLAFLAAGATLASLTLPQHATAPRATVQSGFWSDIREGIQYHRRYPLVGRLLLLSMVGSMGVVGVNVASAAVVTRLLGRPEANLGWLLASIAAGIWAGSTLLSKMGDDDRQYPPLLVVGFLGFAAFTVGVAWSRSLPLTVALYVVGGFLNALILLPIRAWLQTMVPRELRGRVFAARGMGLGITGAAAAILTGVVVTVWTLPNTLDLLAAVTAAAGVLALIWLHPAARAERRRVPAETTSARG